MRSRRLVVCIIATNVAPRELLWRPNIGARWAVDHSFLQLYRSDATALRTHAWRRNRSFRQCSIQLIEKASVTNFIGKSIPRPDRFLSRDRHPGELYPRVGFIVTNMTRPPENVGRESTCAEVGEAHRPCGVQLGCR